MRLLGQSKTKRLDGVAPLQEAKACLATYSFPVQGWCLFTLGGLPCHTRSDFCISTVLSGIRSIPIPSRILYLLRLHPFAQPRKFVIEGNLLRHERCPSILEHGYPVLYACLYGLLLLLLWVGTHVFVSLIFYVEKAGVHQQMKLLL